MTTISILTKTSLSYTVLENADFKTLKTALSPISSLYPKFEGWLDFTFRGGLRSGQRKVILAHYGNEIAGIVLLKNNAFEKKICTFYILENFRGIGVGGELMNLALETLDSYDTFISVASERKAELDPLLDSYGFRLKSSVVGLYRAESTEFFYSL